MIRKLTSLDTYIIRIERGQFLKQSIESLAQEQHWSSARITAGIGAVNNIDIAYFDTSIKGYQRKVFSDNAELISLEGNITRKENKPFIHWHACLSNTDYQSFGGHLFDAQVTVTCELFINTYKDSLPRIQCDAIGLALIDI